MKENTGIYEKIGFMKRKGLRLIKAADLFPVLLS